jgi:hypothetical protein
MQSGADVNTTRAQSVSPGLSARDNPKKATLKNGIKPCLYKEAALSSQAALENGAAVLGPRRLSS